VAQGADIASHLPCAAAIAIDFQPVKDHLDHVKKLQKRATRCRRSVFSRGADG